MQVAFRQSISSVADQRALMFPAHGSCMVLRSVPQRMHLRTVDSFAQLFCLHVKPLRSLAKMTLVFPSMVVRNRSTSTG